MKRHPALVTLSQDHHHALVVAQKLRRADAVTAADAVGAFRAWEPEARRHFHLEEDVLLPALAVRVDPRDDAVVQMLVDHVAIRQAADALDDASPLESLHDLGRRLADHVRLEEQQLFPLVEASLSEDELADLGARLDGHEGSLLDELMPTYDVSDGVAVVVHADREAAWRALLDVDLLVVGREAPLVGLLGALRMLPEVVGHLLHGERPAKPPESMRLRDLPSIPMAGGGWILLGERPPEEIALGLVGRFWRPVIEYADIASADEFRSFDQPGYARTIYDLSVRELAPDRCLLTGVMRTATTDEHARRWFRRYWTFGVGSGAHVLVGSLLDSARRAAEGDAEA